MNLKTFVVLYIIAFVMVVIIPHAHADSQNINTDKILYQNGDTITISGNAGISNSNEVISVAIKNANDDFVVLVSDIADSSGVFEMKVGVETHFLVEGSYFAELYIDDVASNKKTYFEYSPDGSPVVYSTVESFFMGKSPKSKNMQHVSIGSIRLADSFGKDVEFVVADEPIQISTNIGNLVDRNQPFTYIVQIRDDAGVVIHISWFSGMLSEHQSYGVSLSWIPKEQRTYEADVFVWNSFSDVVPLSESKTIPIIVT